MTRNVYNICHCSQMSEIWRVWYCAYIYIRLRVLRCIFLYISACDCVCISVCLCLYICPCVKSSGWSNPWTERSRQKVIAAEESRESSDSGGGRWNRGKDKNYEGPVWKHGQQRDSCWKLRERKNLESCDRSTDTIAHRFNCEVQ